MSMSFFPLSPLRRRFWGEFFGRAIQNAREKRGRSVEEAAQLAGMEAFEWAAIEAGQVPVSPGRIHALAVGLDLADVEICSLILFCREAWSR